MRSRACLKMGMVLGLCALGSLACSSSKSNGGKGSNAEGSAGHKATSAGTAKDAGGATDAASAPSTAVKPGDKASADIAADKGGALTLGGIKANIPAGALSSDTKVTVEVLDKSAQPAASDIVADVFDFGPDGTTFNKPVTLELDVGDLKVPSGKDAMLAYLDGDKWVALADSKLSGGKVTATTMHFTPFTVVLTLTPDGSVAQTGGACPTDNFDACGGDLVGTWEYSAACATFPPGSLGGSSGSDPFAMCTEQPSISLTVDLTGTATFGSDGSFSTDQTITTSTESSVPASCVKQLVMGGDPAMGCTSILKGMLNANGDCVADGKPDMKMQSSKGTFTTQGSTLMIMDSSPDAGSKNEMITYCVRGNTLEVVTKDLDKGLSLHYSATKK